VSLSWTIKEFKKILRSVTSLRYCLASLENDILFSWLVVDRFVEKMELSYNLSYSIKKYQINRFFIGDIMKTGKTPFNRREFLRLLSLAGLGGAVSACKPLAKTLSVPATATANKVSPTTTATPTIRPINADGKATPGQASSTPSSSSTPTPQPTASQAYLSIMHGADPAQITIAAVAALGGMERFVASGDDVIIKPNICTDYYSYEYAATTNPTVVAVLVQLCLGAGAKRVRVMDNPFAGAAQTAYARSGIADAVTAAGGEMEVMDFRKYVTVPIPGGLDLKENTFYKPILDADVVIDVPIAKTHNLAKLTLAGKNLLGTISTPSSIHSNLGQRIADLISLVRPKLIVVDAVRMLMRNGPTGGNLDDVKMANTVIASHDIVAADAYSTTLFGMQPEEISYVKAAAAMGLGTMDLSSIKIEEISI
jgi:uncharacterized protein (DUF362 family)